MIGITDVNPEDFQLKQILANDATSFVYKEELCSIGSYQCKYYIQEQYRLKLPKCAFKIISQDNECIRVRYKSKVYVVNAVSSADWLVINCQDVNFIGSILFDYLKELTQCDYFYTSKRLVINKKSEYINVITNN